MGHSAGAIADIKTLVNLAHISHATTAGKRVWLAVKCVDVVVVGSAVDIIDASFPLDEVETIIAPYRVVAIAACQKGRTSVVRQVVRMIVAVQTVDVVVSYVAIDEIGVIAPVEIVGTIHAPDVVVAVHTVDRVGVRVSGDVVIAVRAVASSATYARLHDGVCDDDTPGKESH